jgi:hypothetical protein
MTMAALIAALTPLGLALLQTFAQKNPSASDDQVKAELERLLESGHRADAAAAQVAADIADAESKK